MSTLAPFLYRTIWAWGKAPIKRSGLGGFPIGSKAGESANLGDFQISMGIPVTSLCVRAPSDSLFRRNFLAWADDVEGARIKSTTLRLVIADLEVGEIIFRTAHTGFTLLNTVWAVWVQF